MLFEHASVITPDGVLNDAYVGVKGDRITYVSEHAPAPEEAKTYTEHLDATGCILMPGLVNTHAHTPMTLLRGWGEALPLDRWLNERIFPFEAKMTPEDAYWATLLGAAEMLRYGTTSFSDMYYFADERFRAVAECGMKMNLGESLIAFEEKPYAEYPLAALNERLIREYHGSCDNRLRLDFNIHAEYTSNPATVRGIAEAAGEAGLRMQVHVSETASEVAGCLERHGMTPPQYLASLGVFDVPCVAAHCVHLHDEDFGVLREHGVFVATNPVSNMKLGSGLAPVARMRAEGIEVTLGTDGPASNNNLDMFQDMYVLGLSANVQAGDPAAVSPADLIYMATRAGALAQGREDTGEISVGMKADICLLDATGVSAQPVHDALANVVYALHGSDVILTMVDGQVLYDGEFRTIDIERVMHECRLRASRIARECSC